MKRFFVVVNYNTPEFVDKLIMSVNKFVPNSELIVFDNSDNKPFINTFNNVSVIDNTRGDIIDFDKFLGKYPKRLYSSGKANNWASAKHTYTIDKCIEMMSDNFILLDSDILLKRDVSDLFNDEFMYVGETVTQQNGKKRILPYLCYINVRMCKENNIHYFDERYMHGLGGSADLYDTGGGFFINTQQFKHKGICLNNYCVHYKGASWGGCDSKQKLSPEQFFEKHKNLWYWE